MGDRRQGNYLLAMRDRYLERMLSHDLQIAIFKKLRKNCPRLTQGGNRRRFSSNIAGYRAVAWIGGSGGGGEIRTHGTLAGTTVFETVAIDHSATPPRSQENPQGVFLGARRLVEALGGRNPWPGASKPICPHIERGRTRPLSMARGRKATRC